MKLATQGMRISQAGSRVTDRNHQNNKRITGNCQNRGSAPLGSLRAHVTELAWNAFQFLGCGRIFHYQGVIATFRTKTDF